MDEKNQLVGLHYDPEQLMQTSRLMRDLLIKEIKERGILNHLPSDQVENEIRIVNKNFDDINTILSKGKFIRIEKR